MKVNMDWMVVNIVIYDLFVFITNIFVLIKVHIYSMLQGNYNLWISDMHEYFAGQATQDGIVIRTFYLFIYRIFIYL